MKGLTKKRSASVACIAVIAIAVVAALASALTGSKPAKELEVGDWVEQTPAEKEQTAKVFTQCRRLIADRRVFAEWPNTRMDLPDILLNGLPDRTEDVKPGGELLDRRDIYTFHGPDPRHYGSSDPIYKKLDFKIEIRISHYKHSDT